MKKSHDKYDKIADYFNARMSKEEAHEFLEWYFSIEGEKELSARMKTVWEEELTNSDTEEWDPSPLLSEINKVKENQRFLTANPAKKKRNQIRHLASILRYSHRIAASIVVLITVSAVVWFGVTNQFAKNDSSKPVEIVKSNPVGQKSMIYLPDGSKIILNSASKVTYPSDFGQNIRAIELEGEAFFEVRKDPDKPFVVTTDELTTTALGTSFNVNAYSKQKNEIALVTGKVSVEQIRSGGKVILHPGESALHDSTTDELNKSNFDLNTKTLWKDGVIHFDNTSLHEAVLTLERWYGIRITIENLPEKDLYCTGVFKNDYLINVLESIGFSLGFDYKIDNKKVKLIFKK